MHSFFVVGAGRSGTSMTASLFRNTLDPPVSSYECRQANPLGFYEDARVNAINESILSRYVPRAPRYDSCGYGADSPADGQLWLARIGLQNDITANEAEQEQIAGVIGDAGFCIKDPRLSYTYACWRECLSAEQEMALKTICVFRHPAHVLNSVFRELMLAEYLQEFAISRNQVLTNWRLQYQWIIQKHAQRDAWFFCDYESLLVGDCLDALEGFCEVELDRSVIRQDLNRCPIELTLDSSSLDLYQELRDLASQSIQRFHSPDCAASPVPPASIADPAEGSGVNVFKQLAAPVPFSASGKSRIKVVMTLLCRNEIDVIRSHLDFHLALGIDHLLVTDNASSDGTLEVLQSYERQGKIILIQEEELNHDQSVWVTRMAQLARESLQADWVLHSDADEFWLPGCMDIAAYFQSLDPALMHLEVPRANMLPPALEQMDLRVPFYVRQMIREVDSLDNLGNPIMGKVCHRAMADVEVLDGNHAIRISGELQSSPAADDFQIIHFPVRTLQQLERKISEGSDALSRNTRIRPIDGITWRELRKRYDAEGSLESYYRSLCLDPRSILEGLREGTLVKEDRVYQLLTLHAPNWRASAAPILGAS